MLFAFICKISRCRSRYLCLLHFILFAIHNLFCCLLQPVARLQLQLAKQLISACSVAAASQLVAHSSSVALNIYDFFRAGCRGRVGVLQVDSLMATFNNYELQFFSVGCCLKKRLCLWPTFGSTNSLETRFNFVWRKKRSCCNCRRCCCSWHVAKKMWQTEDKNLYNKSNCTTTITTIVTCSVQKQQKAIKLWHFASTKAIKVVAARCRQKALAA